jgi:hypothetical protein
VNPFHTPTADDRFVIFLNDHRAVIAGELSLASRCRSANPGTDLSHDLTLHIGELNRDLDRIEEMITDLDGSVDHLRSLAAMVGERIGRLKTNGQYFGYSPLSRVVELDGLVAAASARMSMWTILQHLRRVELPGDVVAGRLDVVDAQIETLRRHLLDASREAFRSERIAV